MEGYTTKVLTYPNAVVTVHRPILSKEERARRMKLIEQAAIALLKSGGV